MKFRSSFGFRGDVAVKGEGKEKKKVGEKNENRAQNHIEY